MKNLFLKILLWILNSRLFRKRFHIKAQTNILKDVDPSLISAVGERMGGMNMFSPNGLDSKKKTIDDEDIPDYCVRLKGK